MATCTKKSCIKDAGIRHINLYFFKGEYKTPTPSYVYYGQVSKRLTKKCMVFLDQWKDAVDEENEDRLDSLFKNNIDSIIDYLNESKLQNYIDLDLWDGKDDLPDTNTLKKCCKACRVREDDDPCLEFVLTCGCTICLYL